MKNERLDRVIVIDKSGFGLEDGTHNAYKFVFDVVQNEAGRFALFGFASQIHAELRTMSTN